MKTIILAGGFGTRLAEYTDVIPKPMVPIGGKPILWHIMNHYAKFNHKDFYLALGYKAEVVKDYFLNYRSLNSDFTIDLSTGNINPHQHDNVDWKVTLVNTGDLSMTGGRVKRMQPFIGNETCMLTYGDGVSNIDLNKLLSFHNSHGKMVTVSAVRPSARFGELEMDGSLVKKFQEKPQLHQGWINGGFFVFEPSFFEFIEGDSTLLEREPLERATNAGQLMAYHHEGFWHCMDTKRDHELLESLWAKGGAPWIS
ncbi:glucose-1-phosphate cytidylyltransferase [Leptospira kanakyensis]|uniref:Glucose-1-phosphate cytidylyltransferase n=1 Tax=Leptospira kanakyensis TaxID=2484968 RepID=A0A6N4QIH5_9LEPT|nr:glucose-1-phosphate cytidylyltransferase [Leptospira kanakyensis]TGK51914.1 glucose-1-phosphate cytidylyltransferase [Leptospira kanakyensis]TGK57178.1 glucose-1-phosphate cytidylyltransferase [Leptospira kanakyensis]TGK71806.1 glucose-1-phosphate cytidylyltransferase [Leptospira kanakyensis]